MRVIGGAYDGGYGFLRSLEEVNAGVTCLNHNPGGTEWKETLYSCHARPDTRFFPAVEKPAGKAESFCGLESRNAEEEND